MKNIKTERLLSLKFAEHINMLNKRSQNAFFQSILSISQMFVFSGNKIENVHF